MVAGGVGSTASLTLSAMLHGRLSERRRIGALLDAARSGVSAALVLRGDPGIGKTALVQHAIAAAHDMTILFAAGAESESELSFAGLAALLDPVLDDIPALPTTQADALRGALALGEAPANPLAVCAATLRLVATAAERRPVLVAVDDAQWIDEPSAEAVVFAARRADRDPVAFIFAVREGEKSVVTRAGLPQLVVGGLDEDSAAALLADAGVTPDVVTRLHEATGGNPLAMVELAGTLDDEQRSGKRPFDHPLPLGPELTRSLRRRIEGLSESARLALLVAATEPSGELAVVYRALDACGVSCDVLDEVEASGLVSREGAQMVFRLPLIRSAVYYGGPPCERRAAHRALAEAQAPGAADRRIWHLASAADGPDERVAALLEGVGEEAARRGALTGAARALERAARLTAEPERRAARLFAAARRRWDAAQIVEAFRLLEEAATTTSEPAFHADIMILRGQAETWRSGPRHGHDLLAAEADIIEDSDPDRAAVLLSHAVGALLLQGDVGAAVPLAHRARAAADRGSGEAILPAAVSEVQALLLHGDIDEALRAFTPLQEVADGLVDSPMPETLYLADRMALVNLLLERWDDARRLAEGAVRKARRDGRVGLLFLSTTLLAEVAWRKGAWNEAYAMASSITTDAMPNCVAAKSYALAHLARIEAGLGLESDCRRHAASALEPAARLGMGTVLVEASAALGLLELGIGNATAAVDRFASICRLSRAWEARNPSDRWWRGDCIEALWRAGHLEDAAREQELLADDAARTRSSWARGTAARGRGLLAGEASFEEALAEALEWHELARCPFEVARTRLCRAERRLRCGRYSDGRADLLGALRTFEQLGAGPWAARARALLGGVELTTELPLLSRLTPAQLRVAMAVGRGLSNKAAAEELFLSVKTVDHHLERIFRRLGLHSRAELVRLVSRHVHSA